MHICRKHKVGKDEAKRRVDEAAGKLAASYNLRYQWHEDDLEFTGTGVDGRIAVTDDAVDIDVKLGFALAMLESQIRSSIETAIDERLDA